MRWGTTTALGIALALILASNALAGSAPDPAPGDKQLGKAAGLAYVSDTETVTNPDYRDALAACPDGGGGSWRIIGGGVAWKGQPDLVTVSASRPLDLYDVFGDDDTINDDYWEATGDGPVGSKLTGYAICAKLPKLKYESVETPDGVVPQRSAVDSCPANTQPTGGGAFIATSGSYLSSFFPSGPSSWGAGVYDTIGGIGGMTTDFVCLHSNDISRVVNKRDLAAGASGAQKAFCPAGTHVTGGGTRLGGASGDGSLISSYPIDGRDSDMVPDDGWKAVGENASWSALKLSAYAICMD